MTCAFDITQLKNLRIVQECRRWTRDRWIDNEQYERIRSDYPSPFYHPNVVIRILLFIATVVALSGATGLLALIFLDAFEHLLAFSALFLGSAAIFLLEVVFIKTYHHYKSGVNEALLYFGLLMLILGFSIAFEFNDHAVALICMLILGAAAYRYLDLISTAGALVSFALFVFNLFNGFEGALRFAVPLVFMVSFVPLYFLFRHLRRRPGTEPWTDCLLISEILALAMICLSGNYFIVREGAQELMNLYLEPGEDIPFAIVFLILTSLIPTLLIIAGIRFRDMVLIRVGLIGAGFAVFTYKYYYSLGHPEITLTVAGAALMLLSIALFRWLRTPRNGFVRELLISDKWTEAQAEAFTISQTLGGNKPGAADDSMKYGGGSFGGGGSGGSYLN